MNTPADFFERCPVCHARLKDAMECRRCGLNFSPILRTVDQAENLAMQARYDLKRGSPREAFSHALRAARVHICPETLESLAIAALALSYFDLAMALWLRIRNDDGGERDKAVENR